MLKPVTDNEAIVSILQSAPTIYLNVTGPKGATGAKLVKQEFVKYNDNGDAVYLQSFDDGTQATFVAPHGPEGPQGPTGPAPYISANGNWFIGFTDTGISARGKAGPQGPEGPQGLQGPQGPEGPTGAKIVNTRWVSLMSDGSYEFEQTFDNGHKARFAAPPGPQGITPHIGDNHNWWIGNKDTGVSAIGMMTFKILPVDKLPSLSDGIYTYALYLVKNEDSVTGDNYTEYMYVNNKWEKIGTTSFSGIVQADIHIQDGNGVGSVEQIPDGVEDGFAFAEYNEDGSVKSYKNTNAIANNAELKALVDRGGKIPYGAFGHYTGAFGGNTSAQGSRAFAMNNKTIAKGDESFAQGYCSVALGGSSYAGGVKTTAVKDSAHAEGTETLAAGEASHSEGERTKALKDYSHAEGLDTSSDGIASHSEGAETVAAGRASHSEGGNTESTKEYAHAEGTTTHATGVASHSEGTETVAAGESSHAEGIGTEARGVGSHAEGEGTSTTDTALGAHAEGIRTVVQGVGAHAEGIDTHAIGEDSHAEGANTHAIGVHSHAGGVYSEAEGYASFTHGVGVKAKYDYQTAIGIGNENRNDTLFEVGNGEPDVTASNAFAVMRDGRAKVKTAPREADDAIRLRDLKVETWTFLLDDEQQVEKHVCILPDNIAALLKQLG